jgi:hypothetical protein
MSRVLTRALRIVAEREQAYDHPRVHWGRTVGMLNALGFRRDGRLLHASDWADAMICDKLARRANDQERLDDLDDIAGYADGAGRLHEDA